ELLIVVAIILIIAAIAIPNLLRSKIAANESSAVGSVRTINSAEVTYFSSWGTGFGAILAVLGGLAGCFGGASGAQACLIDLLLTAGVKSGYTFLAVGVNPVNNVLNTFEVNAMFMVVQTTGVRSFCADQTGFIQFLGTGAGIST